MDILVTGGAGFIGSNLVKKLLSMNHRVWSLDNLSTGSLTFLNEVLHHPNHRFIEGTVLNRDLMKTLIQQTDVVFHLSAVLGVKNTVENPLKVIEGNIDGTRNVLELAYEMGRKVIFASTSEVYGKNRDLPFREDSDRVYGSTSIHRWCYATAKSLDEHMCLGYAQKGLPVTILRYFNAYGPGQTNSQYGMVVPRFIMAALEGRPLEVYGDGSQSRCFTFIDDTVQGTVQALSSKADGLIFNIGSEQSITIKQLAELVIRMTGSPSEILIKPYDEAYGPGYEDMPARKPDLTRSKGILGYDPQVGIDLGLERTIEWYRQELGIHR